MSFGSRGRRLFSGRTVNGFTLRTRELGAVNCYGSSAVSSCFAAFKSARAGNVKRAAGQGPRDFQGAARAARVVAKTPKARQQASSMGELPFSLGATAA